MSVPREDGLWNPNSSSSDWSTDEATLAAIGAALSEQATEVAVRIPQALADAALSAWQREDESEELDLAGETADQRTTRYRAGTLALIGAAIEARGRTEGEAVALSLDAWFIGDALSAADDHNLIVQRGIEASGQGRTISENSRFKE